MVRYDVMGFSDEKGYFDHFLKTLLKTNWTYDYFVEWKKVRHNLSNYPQEISQLNSISKTPAKHRKEELKQIFIKHPETVRLLPLIIATRGQNIPILEIEEKATYKDFNFSLRGINQEEATNLVSFCEKVGVLSLLGEINDLYAYLLGVEVGLDSNARKNRSGNIFETLIGSLLKKKLNHLNLQIKAEDQNIQTGRKKRADFVVYSQDKPKIVIECNFYNTTGSKPIETANAYIDLQRKIRENCDISFIWITDGLAWTKMNKTVSQSFSEIDFPLNYTIAEENLEQIVSKLL